MGGNSLLESQLTPLGTVPISSIWGKAVYMGGPTTDMRATPREEPVRVKPRWPSCLASPKLKPTSVSSEGPKKPRWPACLSPKLKRAPVTAEAPRMPRWPACLSPKLNRASMAAEGTSASSWSWKTVCGIKCRDVTKLNVNKTEVNQVSDAKRTAVTIGPASNIETVEGKYIRYATPRGPQTSSLVRPRLPSTYRPPNPSSTYGRYPLHPLYTWRKAASRSFKYFSPRGSLSSRFSSFTRKFTDFRRRFY